MKIINGGGRFSHILKYRLARALIVAGFLLCGFKEFSQSAPVLTIAPTGTNQVLITVIDTNPATYYLQMTPALGNTNFPFAIIANGAVGQTNFSVNIGPFADEFFRVLVATNNPGQGIAVFIDSPANGATVQ